MVPPDRFKRGRGRCLGTDCDAFGAGCFFLGFACVRVCVWCVCMCCWEGGEAPGNVGYWVCVLRFEFCVLRLGHLGARLYAFEIVRLRPAGVEVCREDGVSVAS